VQYIYQSKWSPCFPDCFARRIWQQPLGRSCGDPGDHYYHHHRFSRSFLLPSKRQETHIYCLSFSSPISPIQSTRYIPTLPTYLPTYLGIPREQSVSQSVSQSVRPPWLPSFPSSLFRYSQRQRSLLLPLSLALPLPPRLPLPLSRPRPLPRPLPLLPTYRHATIAPAASPPRARTYTSPTCSAGRPARSRTRRSPACRAASASAATSRRPRRPRWMIASAARRARGIPTIRVSIHTYIHIHPYRYIYTF